MQRGATGIWHVSARHCSLETKVFRSAIIDRASALQLRLRKKYRKLATRDKNVNIAVVAAHSAPSLRTLLR